MPPLPGGALPRVDDQGRPLGAPPPQPAADITERAIDKAASSVASRVFRDVVTFAVLTSPAWIVLLLVPRTQRT